jgi:type IV pilus assembly protein PilV
MSMRALPPPRPARGFTLIEVLISLAILAVGLLGMTALQTEALKYNNAAFTDSQAQFLLNDMMERIRANSTSNLYVMTYIQPPDPAPVNCGSVSAACNSNQMALWDMNQWLTQVRSLLPGGQGQILFNPLNRTYVISIRYRWDQIGGGDDVINDQRVLTITSM